MKNIINILANIKLALIATLEQEGVAVRLLGYDKNIQEAIAEATWVALGEQSPLHQPVPEVQSNTELEERVMSYLSFIEKNEVRRETMEAIVGLVWLLKSLDKEVSKC